mmetsp:Transcript_10051/g.11531  ORF Transcript_10051/g.11531 Transcript_10051/m.11531 type:complete len:202 (+) Transcript_10051:28-633(+)
MFLPQKDDEKKKADKERREGITRVEDWAKEEIPEALQKDVTINAQEVKCGDPDCAPIDTLVAIIFASGGRGMMGLPMEAREVKKDDIVHSFPTMDVLKAWHSGEEAEWPPPDADDAIDDETPAEDFKLPDLRFEINQKVQCRIGPDPVTGWASGIVIQLWYKESTWPPNSWAPYKILLDDGRSIFAPGDVDQIIRKDINFP